MSFFPILIESIVHWFSFVLCHAPSKYATSICFNTLNARSRSSGNSELSSRIAHISAVMCFASHFFWIFPIIKYCYYTEAYYVYVGYCKKEIRKRESIIVSEMPQRTCDSIIFFFQSARVLSSRNIHSTCVRLLISSAIWYNLHNNVTTVSNAISIHRLLSRATRL